MVWFLSGAGASCVTICYNFDPLPSLELVTYLADVGVTFEAGEGPVPGH